MHRKSVFSIYRFLFFFFFSSTGFVRRLWQHGKGYVGQCLWMGSILRYSWISGDQVYIGKCERKRRRGTWCEGFPVPKYSQQDNERNCGVCFITINAFISRLFGSDQLLLLFLFHSRVYIIKNCEKKIFIRRSTDANRTMVRLTDKDGFDIAEQLLARKLTIAK